MRDQCAREHMLCMVALDSNAGRHARQIRTPALGVLDWITRKERGMMRRLWPDSAGSTHIRGSRVAAENLLHALLRSAKLADFAFVVPDRERSEIEQAVTALKSQDRQKTSFYGIAEIFQKGLHTCHPDLWLDFEGSGFPWMHLRNQEYSHIYPVISLQHGLSNRALLSTKFLRILSTLHYPCDSLICSSEASRRALTTIFETISCSYRERFGAQLTFQGRLDVIPLCIDTTRLRPREKEPLRRKLGIEQSATVFLSVGYISQVKADLFPLLPIVARLKKQHPEKLVLFVIAGTGGDRYLSELQSCIRELDLSKNVILLSDISDSTKEELMAAADIFLGCSNSLEESFGLAPVEAMACGLPQIVSDWSGYRETVVHDQTGFLIPTLWGRCDSSLRCTGDFLGWAYDHVVQGQAVAIDTVRLYESMETLMCQAELRAEMSRRSRTRALSEFSYESVALKYEALWAELICIANMQGPRHERTTKDSPGYYDTFRHYASREIDKHTIVRLGPSDVLSLERLMRVPAAELSCSSIIDRTILKALCDRVEMSEKEACFANAECLIGLVAQGSWGQEDVRRHLLFLIKHGVLVVT